VVIRSSEEYSRRVKKMEKFILPLKQEIKDNPGHAKLNKLLEIISRPNKRSVPNALLDKCEEILKKKFKDQVTDSSP